MSRLVTRDPADSVVSVMDAAVEAIPCDQAAQDVAREFSNRDLVSAPVVDAGGKLIGQITIDDVVDVIEEQAEHAVLSMAGLDEEDDMFAPVVTSVRRHGPARRRDRGGLTRTRRSSAGTPRCR